MQTAVFHPIWLALALAATSVQAGGFSPQSEQQQLVDHTIVYAGLLTEERDLQTADREALSHSPLRTEKLYRLGGYCFYSNFIDSYSPAMIVVDKFNQSKVAVFDTGHSDLDVRLYSVQLLSCNDIRKAKVQQMLDKSKGVLEDLEREQQRNLQLLKQLQDAERTRKSQQ